MAEQETQTWISTGRGGAGNFPYTPRALSKRPVAPVSAPVGREVDYRRQSVARSGRNGVGFWEPTPSDETRQKEAEEYERDQAAIKTQNRQSMTGVDGSHVFRSGRGGYGSYAAPVTVEDRLPTTTRDVTNPGVHSYGRGGGNYRDGNLIPLVDLNRIETQERVEAKSRPTQVTSQPDSGLSTFISYTTAFLNSLTPAENRIENMADSQTKAAPRRTSVLDGGGGGGRGGANKYGYAAYTPRHGAANGHVPPPTVERQYSAYSSHEYAPEMPSGSNSHAGPSGSRP